MFRNTEPLATSYPLYPINAWSSLALVPAGLYLLHVEETSTAAVVCCLAVISVGWWATQRECLQRWDLALVHCTALWPVARFCRIPPPLVYGVCIAGTHAGLSSDNGRRFVKYSIVCSVLNATFTLYIMHEYWCAILLIAGIVAKLCIQKYGTGIMHVAVAAALVVHAANVGTDFRQGWKRNAGIPNESTEGGYSPYNGRASAAGGQYLGPNCCGGRHWYTCAAEVRPGPKN